MRENMKLKLEKNNLWAHEIILYVPLRTPLLWPTLLTTYLEFILLSSGQIRLTFCYFWSHLVFRSEIDRKKRNFFYRRLIIVRFERDIICRW